jgi:lauroyl/myristoyl acyltransferase
LHTEQKVIPTLLERLNQGKLVALVADKRFIKKWNKEVDFINRTAKMPSGPARLILDSKAAFISAYITYTEMESTSNLRKLDLNQLQDLKKRD